MPLHFGGKFYRCLDVPMELLDNRQYDNVNFTVPAGKVWKIEAAVNWSGNSLMLYPNGAVNYGINLASSSKTVSDFPIWLNSGYTGQFSIYTNRALISIIEFNVVP